MKDASTIKSLLKKYLLAGSKGNYISSNGITIITSGSESSIMNFAMIDDADRANKNANFIMQNFNINGFVLSNTSDRDVVGRILPNSKHLGLLVIAKSDGYNGLIHSVDSIDVKKMNKDTVEDYVDFMASQRGVEKEIMRTIVSSVFDDLFIYLAYAGDEVVGAGTAIRKDRNIFVFDAVVKSEMMNNGVFSSIVTKSMSDASSEGEYSYYAFISSKPSLNGAAKANFQKDDIVDLWINKEVPN